MKNIKQLEKEIEEIKNSKEAYGYFTTKSKRETKNLGYIETLTELQTLQEVCEEIENRVLYLNKEKDKKGKKKVGDIVYLHIYDMINELKELLKKFKGEEE